MTKANSREVTPEVIGICVCGCAMDSNRPYQIKHTSPDAKFYCVYQAFKSSDWRHSQQLITETKTLPGALLAARTQAEKVNVPVWDLSGRTIPPETL